MWHSDLGSEAVVKGWVVDSRRPLSSESGPFSLERQRAAYTASTNNRMRIGTLGPAVRLTAMPRHILAASTTAQLRCENYVDFAGQLFARHTSRPRLPRLPRSSAMAKTASGTIRRQDLFLHESDSSNSSRVVETKVSQGSLQRSVLGATNNHECASV